MTKRRRSWQKPWPSLEARTREPIRFQSSVREKVILFIRSYIMAGKYTAVFGIYKSSAQAEHAVDRIGAAGFSPNDISVLLPDNQSSKEFAHEKNTKAPEGAATGVTTGGVVGGTLGLLAGIGALAIPVLG